MSEFLNHPEIFNEPVLLTESEMKEPLLVIQRFFDDYRLSELRQKSEEIQGVCLTTDDPPFADPDRRAELLLFERELLTLLEAAFLLAKNKSQ